ncbi:MAG: chlorite dismutase family protein [Sandaracinaceae bacterium]
MAEQSAGGRRPPGLPDIDVNEYGGKRDGERQAMDRRLFMQLLVLDCPRDVDPEDAAQALIRGLEEKEVPGVVYEDANAPLGFGLLTWSDDPTHFVKNVRPVFRDPILRALVPRHDATMIGRTYSGGYEPNLAYTMLQRSVDNVTQPDWPWAVWYPLRRSGAFSQLERTEQATILREHASIGMAYGRQELAHDVRLACHGLDANDNEFLIGLVGKTLHPLSHVVQRMRRTKQTSEYITQMGPFFVGLARWQSAGPRLAEK